MDKPCSCDALIVTSQKTVGNTTEIKDEYQTRWSILPHKRGFHITIRNINLVSLRYRIVFSRVAMIISFFFKFGVKFFVSLYIYTVTNLR